MITETPTIRLHIEAECHDEPALLSGNNAIESPTIQSLIDLFPQVTGWEIGRVRNRLPTEKSAGQSAFQSSPLPSSPLPSSRMTPSSLTSADHSSDGSIFGDTSLEGGSESKLEVVDMWADWPDGRHCANRQKCDSLIDVFNAMVDQVRSTQQQIELLNAQLATAIPLTSSANSGQVLLARMEKVIQEGMSLLDATAGGLYLLDDATRELHLRVQVGLSAESFLRPPRKLRESIADLEALVGHPFSVSNSTPQNRPSEPEIRLHPVDWLEAHKRGEESNPKILTSEPAPHVGQGASKSATGAAGTQNPTWNLPEEFPAALCVPVATHSTPLGTLWFFSEQERGFSEKEISLAEVIGGRLSAELEKESAIRAGTTTRKLIRDLDRAKLWQQLQSPPPLPELEGWEVVGGQFLEQEVGGTVVDYSISSAGELVAAVGDIQGAVFESSLAAASMRGAMRSLEPLNLDPHRFLNEINNTLWNCPLGDQIASLFLVRLDTATGISYWSNSGENGALIIGRGSEGELVDVASPLGACPDEEFDSRNRVILPGSTLFAFNSGFRKLFKYSFQQSNDEDIIHQLQQAAILKPSDIQRWVEELVGGFDSYRTTPDVSFVAVHRSLEE